MKTYKVEIDSSALADIEELTDWLYSMMSLHTANRYLDAMAAEIKSLSLFANLYGVSRYRDVRAVHPMARRMVSHNKKWMYIFHIEKDVVVVDRIRPVKMIKG